MESSLNALIFEVSGTCGPRQKSMKCGPSVYSREDVAGALLDQLALHPGVGIFLEAFVFARCRTRS